MGKLKALPQNSEANTALKQLSQTKPRAKCVNEEYAQFDQLDGTHPWQDIVPEGMISYQVRQLKNGKVAYFNFNLAEEMGLIPKNHNRILTKKLEEKILEAFALRIINEYDIENKIYYDKSTIKPHKYMATRYLQLQHESKKGETSGDGRCIWNGTVVHKGITWDVSSRGTGVTALAPGAVQAGEPLRSGNEDFGYGCGLAEIDELYSAAIMAEINYLNGVNTERMLTVIDLGGGIGIGVRASKNLLRPAHLFMFLKQENYDALKRGTDYLLLRQIQNKEWPISYRSPNKYNSMLNEIATSFAKFAAHLEREYIFAWLDWDGDNVLATAGIIDYGSVRQFGLRHDQYRYDDVERFSTNLNEQKSKARLTVQVFAQVVDYLNTKVRKPLHNYKDDSSLKIFDDAFEHEKLRLFLQQCGFKDKLVDKLIDKNRDLVTASLNIFEQIEKTKTHKKQERVADGINRPAILNMRKFLHYLVGNLREKFNADLAFEQMVSKKAKGKDLHLNPSLRSKLEEFHTKYIQLIDTLANEKNQKLINENLVVHVKKYNNTDRVTGNALLYVVNEILENRKKGLKHKEVQKIIDNFIFEQTPPTSNAPLPKRRNLKSTRAKNLMETILEITETHNEDI